MKSSRIPFPHIALITTHINVNFSNTSLFVAYFKQEFRFFPGVQHRWIQANCVFNERPYMSRIRTFKEYMPRIFPMVVTEATPGAMEYIPLDEPVLGLKCSRKSLGMSRNKLPAQNQFIPYHYWLETFHSMIGTSSREFTISCWRPNNTVLFHESVNLRASDSTLQSTSSKV